MYFIDNSLIELLPNTYAKPPIFYPGGKVMAVKYLLSLIPNNYETYASPFAGGCSIECAIASCGKQAYAYDIFDYVVDFWNEALVNAPAIADYAMTEHPITRDRFYELQHADHSSESRFQKACVYYILNKSSFGGTGFSGGYSTSSPRNFSIAGIERLRNFSCPNLHVSKLDFCKSIPAHENDFLYLDPPYANKAQNLYGKNGNTHKTFDHEGLAEIMNKRDKWIMSYNECDYVKELYKGHRMITLDWHHGLSTVHYNELVIFSDDIPEIKER